MVQASEVIVNHHSKPTQTIINIVSLLRELVVVERVQPFPLLFRAVDWLAVEQYMSRLLGIDPLATPSNSYEWSLLILRLAPIWQLQRAGRLDVLAAVQDLDDNALRLPGVWGSVQRRLELEWDRRVATIRAECARIRSAAVRALMVGDAHHSTDRTAHKQEVLHNKQEEAKTPEVEKDVTRPKVKAQPQRPHARASTAHTSDASGRHCDTDAAGTAPEAPPDYVRQVQVLMRDKRTSAQDVLQFLEQFHVPDCKVVVTWRKVHKRLARLVATRNWDAVQAQLRSKLVVNHRWTFPTIEHLMHQQIQLRGRLESLARMWCADRSMAPTATPTLTQVDEALVEVGAMKLRASRRIMRLHQDVIRRLTALRKQLQEQDHVEPSLEPSLEPTRVLRKARAHTAPRRQVTKGDDGHPGAVTLATANVDKLCARMAQQLGPGRFWTVSHPPGPPPSQVAS